MTRGLKVADGLLFERRLICDERGGQALRGGGTGGGYEGPSRKGMRLGGIQMVCRPLGPDGSRATKKLRPWVTGRQRNGGRGTAKLSGTLTFDVLEKLPRHSYVVRLQCGAPNPRGTVKWTGVRFSDFAQAVGAQSFANYCRLVGSDAYFIDEDMTTLMHPQVVLAWQLNDAPIPPQHGAPLRLIVPFRYGARSLKAITEIQFTATSFTPPKPWPT
jgi:hypothetical protein